jgi:hypothetical protein
MEILKLSAKTGEGMDEFLDFLQQKRARIRESHHARLGGCES